VSNENFERDTGYARDARATYTMDGSELLEIYDAGRKDQEAEIGRLRTAILTGETGGVLRELLRRAEQRESDLRKAVEATRAEAWTRAAAFSGTGVGDAYTNVERRLSAALEEK
jgi:hypothetical protein